MADHYELHDSGGSGFPARVYDLARARQKAQEMANAKGVGVTVYSYPTDRSTRGKVMGTYRPKKNPMSTPTGKFFKVNAARVNRDGSVTLSIPDSVVKRNPALRRNIAGGMMTATGFHPFRSSPNYDPDRAGDEYGARTDNKGFTRVRKGAAKKKAAPKRKAAPKKKAKAKTKKRR